MLAVQRNELPDALCKAVVVCMPLNHLVPSASTRLSVVACTAPPLICRLQRFTHDRSHAQAIVELAILGPLGHSAMARLPTWRTTPWGPKSN